MTKNRQKLNCATFFEKFKNCYFFWIFAKKNRNVLFFKIFRPNKQPPFSWKFLKGFLKFLENYSIYFPHCFCPLRRVIKTSFEKKSKKKSNFIFVKKFRKFFFDEIWKIFKGISLIKTKVDFSRYRVRIPVGALSFDHIK